MKAGFLALLCVALVAAREGIVQCRTRTAQDLQSASQARVVWTPFVRKGAQVANTFFNAAEFAGVLGNGQGLPDVAPCVMAKAESEGGQTTFRAVRGGVIQSSAFPESFECSDGAGVRVASLRDVAGEVLIVGHGNSNEPRLDVAFGPAGDMHRESFTPDELAELLVEEGLACDHQQVTVLIVQGGLRLTKEGANRRLIELTRRIKAARGNKKVLEELQADWSALSMRQRDPDVFENNDNIGARDVPFVALLANALASRGFLNVRVSGFRGEVLPRMGRSPTNPGPYQGLKMYVTASMLAENLCQARPDLDQHACEDSLLAPCDECMLSLSKTGASYLKRAKHCRTKLLRSSNVADRNSAQACGAEAQYASSKWLFSVKSNEVKYEDD